MTSSWRWFIHPETAISMNRNGSRTLCVFKVHYRDHRAAVGNHRRFTQIQFSDHTGSDLLAGDQTRGDSVPERLPDEISLYRACIDHQSVRRGRRNLKPFTVRLNQNTIL